MSKLSELIKNKRLELGVSQTRLADFLGLKNEQYISNFERNLCYIPYKYLGRISQRLRLPVSDIEDAIMLDERDKFRRVLNESIAKNTDQNTRA